MAENTMLPGIEEILNSNEDEVPFSKSQVRIVSMKLRATQKEKWSLQGWFILDILVHVSLAYSEIR